MQALGGQIANPQPRARGYKSQSNQPQIIDLRSSNQLEREGCPNRTNDDIISRDLILRGIDDVNNARCDRDVVGQLVLVERF